MTTQRNPTEVVHSRLPKRVLRELRRHALEEGRSLSNYVAKVLTDHINDANKEG